MRNNLRIVRKVGLADALFTQTRQRILSTLLLNADRSWYLSELANTLGTGPSSLQRELTSLVSAGVLTRTVNGNRTYYQGDKGCPVFCELRGLLIKTSGLVEQVKAELTPFATQVVIAFIFGSIAANSETSRSDVDLLIVGAMKLASLSGVVKSLEHQISRPVNPTLYSPGEFQKMVREQNHFLITVLNEPKLLIIGTDDDLARLATGGTSEAALDLDSGAQ